MDGFATTKAGGRGGWRLFCQRDADGRVQRAYATRHGSCAALLTSKRNCKACRSRQLRACPMLRTGAGNARKARPLQDSGDARGTHTGAGRRWWEKCTCGHSAAPPASQPAVKRLWEPGRLGGRRHAEAPGQRRVPAARAGLAVALGDSPGCVTEGSSGS